MKKTTYIQPSIFVETISLALSINDVSTDIGPIPDDPTPGGEGDFSVKGENGKDWETL